MIDRECYLNLDLMMRCIYNAHYSNKNTLRPFHSIIHNVYTMPVHLFNCPALCRRTTHSIATGIHLLPTPTGAYFGLAWNGRLLPSVSVIDEAGDIQWKLSSRCICVAMENQLGRRIPCLAMAACVACYCHLQLPLPLENWSQCQCCSLWGAGAVLPIFSSANQND